MTRFINNTVTPTACSRWAPTTAYSHQSYHARPYTRHYSVTQPFPAGHLINPSQRPAPSDVTPQRYQYPFQISGRAINYSLQPTIYPIYGHCYGIHCAPKITGHSYRRAPQQTAQASLATMINPCISSRIDSPSPLAFTTRPYQATIPAAAHSYAPSPLAPYRESAQLMPSGATVRLLHHNRQAARTTPQPTYPRTAPHWTASSRIYAPSPLAFTTRPYQATTAAGHSYAPSPLAPYRESAQLMPSGATVRLLHRNRQAARTTPQPTPNQHGDRPVDQARALSMRLQPSNTAQPITASPATLFHRAYWKAFEGAVGSDSFYTLLGKLKDHHQNHPRDQVPRRLEALHQMMIHNPELRQDLLDEAQIGSESCSDRAIATLNQLETRCAIEHSIQGKKVDDRALLTIMRGLFRQDELYKIAERHVAQQQAQQQLLPANQRPILDPVETHLFYHIALKERLQLPGGTKSMTFTTTANVTAEEAERAGNKILCIEKLEPKSLIDFISNNEHWQRYLKQHYQSLHDQDESIARYGALMEQLEEASEQQEINEEEYLQRCHQLMQERKTASNAWFLAKTQELIHKHLTPQGYPIASNG